MHQLATGTAGPLGLAGSEPPVSTETIGRAPSIFDAAVPLRSLEELVGLPRRSETEAPPVEELPPAAVTDRRRLVVRLLGGEDVEVGVFDGPETAVAQAREIVDALRTAESSGEWPEVGGRFLRPASIVSVDVLVSDD